MDKELIIAICERLKDAVPQLRWIDIEEGQLDTEERPAAAWPCAFVDIAYINCESGAAGKQTVTAEINLRIAFLRTGTTNAAAPIEVRKKALEKYDIINNIHQALQWWDNGKFAPLQRIKATSAGCYDGIKIFNIVYRTKFME